MFKAYNEITRQYETIDPDEAELFPGQSVIRLFWCKAIEKFVTVPGASLYTVNASGEFELNQE